MEILKAEEILKNKFDMDLKENESHRKNQVLKGLLILNKYEKDVSITAEHDQIWSCLFEETVGKMSEDDFMEMIRLGWFEEDDCWSKFV